jgi:hypothetical protein
MPTIFEPGMSTSAARKKYRAHKSGAEKRGIEFRLTFEEWFFIWLTSGHLHERGKGKNKYCMARNGDKGAYERNR